jgi:exosortase K
VLSAAAVKLFYSTAGVEQLGWILAPTAFLVETVAGARFEFVSGAGYLSGDRSLLIAAPCAGVNFLITAFLMLSLRRLWGDRPRATPWRLIPCAALCAYLATLFANAVRISAAMALRGTGLASGQLNPNQLHRLEGVSVYFVCLLLLFVMTDRRGSVDSSASDDAAGLLRRLTFPLLVYYATTLGIPILNGAYRRGDEFLEHSLFVLLIPLLLILPLAAFRLYRDRRAAVTIKFRTFFSRV